jgi:RimJ/RimL family protein N-acetyltransferase
MTVYFSVLTQPLNSGKELNHVKQRPSLTTERLHLRPFTLNDAPAVQRLAGDRDIASTTLQIPHPYEDGMAEQWIATHQENYEKGESVLFAIVARPDDTLIGAMGLRIHPQHANAELGYWIGKSYWNRGYATEAAHAVVAHGFKVLGLRRIYAHCNPSSARILQKLGMRYEGRLRQHIAKWGEFEDMEIYGLLSEEYSVQV